MLLTLNSNRRLFKADKGNVFLDNQRWNTGAAIVGTRYSLAYRIKRRLRQWLGMRG